jgi:hypothetical protein
VLKYSLFGLFLVVMVAAIGCAAIAGSNELWRQAMLTLTVGILITANLAAIFRPSGRRAFAGGFAIAGWLYFLLAFDPALGLRNSLLTQRAAERLGAAIHEQPSAQQIAKMNIWEADTGRVVVGSGATFVPTAPPANAAFHDIVHANWTLLIALIGGLVARLFAGRRAQPSETGEQSEAHSG